MTLQLKNPVSQHDHTQGTKTATLQLVEYGDYQCPSCGDAYLVLKDVIRELGNNVVFIFRNFPLTDIHPEAFEAALAAEAAALQSKFWEMYDLLFQNQAYLSENDLFAYAERIGLDQERFRQDIQSQALTSKIEANIKSGLKCGVSGTPTFFINGEKYEGDWQGDGLIQFLKGLL